VHEQEGPVLLADLVDSVAELTKNPKTVVDDVLRAALNAIEGSVSKGQTVNLVGFGRFEVYQRTARVGRNLRTGETLKIPATRSVRFKIGKRLRDAASTPARKGGGKGKKKA
jgi:nucleoid DNA-binding protein